MADSEAVMDLLVELIDTDYDKIPPVIRERARACIRDVVGVDVYGSHHEVGRKIGRYVDTTASGTTATLFGGQSANPVGAALANGTFAHAIDSGTLSIDQVAAQK